MSAFKAKRVSGNDLVAAIAPATASLPPVVVKPGPAAEPPPARAAKTVQVNFKASEAFAEVLAEAAQEAGSTRRFLAKLMRDAGFTVPDVDVNPPDLRRRARRDSAF